jgi:hypothetical protein
MPPTRTTLQRTNRPIDRSKRSRRDPKLRRTNKPKVTLAQTSETSILRTAMDTIGECFQHCLRQGGEHVEQEHLRRMLDAWDLLNATATLVSRDSPYAENIEEVCAEAVKDCEESCEDFPEDQMMLACADVCREAYEHLTA